MNGLPRILLLALFLPFVAGCGFLPPTLTDTLGQMSYSNMDNYDMTDEEYRNAYERPDHVTCNKSDTACVVDAAGAGKDVTVVDDDGNVDQEVKQDATCPAPGGACHAAARRDGRDVNFEDGSPPDNSNFRDGANPGMRSSGGN